MTTKVQPISGMEDTIQTAITATASVTSTVSPKVSLFAKKSGFVIPKNKLSGSLVPIFRGGKKPGGTDVEGEESNKQVLRKTKWGPDLTQDAFVRKGRASAYQTRLDQITQQLKSGLMEARDDHDLSVTHGAAQESLDNQSIQKSELELERREVIGEILKLNPSYKAPADYKPVLKEDKVAIPIKEYPGRNFIGLIFGPAGDTQKRLEKETGAKIRVYGTKADARKEIEITSSDGNETHGDYEDLYVLVTAETYEKIDAAVSLIELLVTPVANTAAASTKDSVPGDNPNTVGLSQDTPSSYTIPPVLVNQGVVQPFTGSGQAPPLTQFQPYPNQWLPTVQSTGFITPPFPNISVPMLGANPLQRSSAPSNSAAMPSSFGPQPAMPGPFGSVPHNPSHVPSQPQPIHQHPHMLQVPKLGYAGPPRNPSLPPSQIAPGQLNFSAPLPFTPNPPTPTGPNQNVRPTGSPIPRSATPFTFPDRPLTSSGWSQPPVGSPGPLGPSMPQILQSMVRPQASGSQPVAISGVQSSSFRPSPPSPVAPLPPVVPHTGAPNSVPGSWFPLSTTSTSIPPPSVRPQPITTLRPQQPSSNDFTFQAHRGQTPTSLQVPMPGSQPGSQFMRPQHPQVHPPQSPSFRPGMNNHGTPPIMQGLHRPQNSHRPMSQQHPGAPLDRQPVFPGHGPRLNVPSSGPRLFGSGSPASPFPHRPGNLGHAPQNHPSVGLFGPLNQQLRGNVTYSLGRPSGRPPQVYDPFSPTAMPHKAGTGTPQIPRKQDNDPEYDDLMASVGVK